jgi:hypothetical protein
VWAVNAGPREAGTVATANDAWAVALGDLDGDQIPDLVIGGTSYLNLWFGNGDGTFHGGGSLSVGVVWAVALGDLDQDHRLDVVTGELESSQVGLFKVIAAGRLAPTSSLTAGPLSTSVVLGDVDGNGRLDVVAWGGPRTATLFLGRGGGAFGPPRDVDVGAAESPGFYRQSLALGDFDRDGVLDLVAAGDRGVIVARGRGDGTFAPPPAVDFGPGVIKVMAAGDVDGDGNLDLSAATVDDQGLPGRSDVAVSALGSINVLLATQVPGCR